MQTLNLSPGLVGLAESGLSLCSLWVGEGIWWRNGGCFAGRNKGAGVWGEGAATLGQPLLSLQGLGPAVPSDGGTHWTTTPCRPQLPAHPPLASSASLSLSGVCFVALLPGPRLFPSALL